VGKILSLQSLRFAAALAVVALHAVWVVFNATGQKGVLFAVADAVGRAGVDVFFVLSGVIIALVAPGMTAGEFMVRRLRRIYPIHLTLAAPWIAFAAIVGTLNWRNLLSTVALWPVTDRLTKPLSPVAWTLCFEMLFYACAALVLWRRWMLWPILAAYAGALVLRQGPLLQFLGNPLCLEFLAGVGLARLPRSRWAAAALPAGVALLALFALLPLPPHDAQLLWRNAAEGWIRLGAQGLPATLIVWGALQVAARPGVTTYLGDASYSLYLIHPLILVLYSALLTKAPAGIPADLLGLASIGLSVLAGWRVYEAIEKPLLAAFAPSGWVGRRIIVRTAP
jgi:exopolysaccharide production protein ExoZ